MNADEPDGKIQVYDNSAIGAKKNMETSKYLQR